MTSGATGSFVGSSTLLHLVLSILCGVSNIRS
jgi:hypothetical protein